MFNVGSGELAVIAVVALLVLGPKRLPELARGLGKFMREFRRQTDEVRTVVEREFYRMDQDVPLDAPPPTIRPAGGLPQGTTAEDFVSQAAARTRVADVVAATAAGVAPPPVGAPTEDFAARAAARLKAAEDAAAARAGAPLVVQSEPSQVTRGTEKPEAPAPVADAPPPKKDV